MIATAEKQYECKTCGRTWAGSKRRGPTRVYCSAECRAEGTRKRMMPPYQCSGCGEPCWSESGCKSCCRTIWRWCAVCGDRFRKGGGESAGRCCSRECGFKLLAEVYSLRKIGRWQPWPRCGQCGALRSRKPGLPKLCGCKPKPAQSYVCVAGQAVTLACRQCGTEMSCLRRPSGRKWLCDECKQENVREQRRNREKARRAKERQTAVEPVKRREIFDRDGWRCQRCGVKTRPDWNPKHDRYPSLDHIVPIARGGEHTVRNLQTLCLGCNVGIRDDMSGKQLRMM